MSAQIRPQPGAGDPRIQSIEYDASQVVQIQAAPGYQVTLEFGSDEQIENVAVGDSGAWQVTANRAGSRLFVKPVQSGVTTNMTVVTNVRIYAFELVPLFGPSPDMAYTIRFRYPAAGRRLGERRGRADHRGPLPAERRAHAAAEPDQRRRPPHLYRIPPRPGDPGHLRGRRARRNRSSTA